MAVTILHQCCKITFMITVASMPENELRHLSSSGWVSRFSAGTLEKLVLVLYIIFV